MAGHDIIVVGASAGGVTALESLFANLPPDLPAAVCVVLHVAAGKPSILPDILRRSRGLHVAHAVDGEAIIYGRGYVAPPDRHLLLENQRLRLTRGPRENMSRPAIDPLFRTAAVQYGPRVVGVLLTGMMDDGSAGLAAIKACGGKAIVQDPLTATWPDMPLAAMRSVPVDYCLPLSDIPAVLVRLVSRRAGRRVRCSPPLDVQFQVSTEKGSDDMRKLLETEGRPSQLACPECQGPIWELKEAGAPHFRCQVGHAFNGESFREAQTERIERALWTAVSALEDKAAFSRRLEARMRAANMANIARMYEEERVKAARQADLIRRVILGKPKKERRNGSLPKRAATRADGRRASPRPRRGRPASRTRTLARTRTEALGARRAAPEFPPLPQ
jgi:two-component system chemotaxis response regulator CheB